jgi:TetR/AcrR family transcriptional regulator, transcriptional repressor for nem operon
MSQTPHAETAGLPRLTRKGQATRDRIVEAAAALMFRQGVAGTTTEQVQAAAGVSASQIFHYFGDKRALVRAVIADQAEAVLTAQQPLGRLDSMQALRAWAGQYVSIQEQLEYAGGCPLGSLGSELAGTDPAARRDVERGFARWEGAIRGGLRAMYARGDLRRGADPDALALALLTALEGGLLMTKIRRDPAPLRTVLDVVLAHIESLTPRRARTSR